MAKSIAPIPSKRDDIFSELQADDTVEVLRASTGIKAPITASDLSSFLGSGGGGGTGASPDDIRKATDATGPVEIGSAAQQPISIKPQTTQEGASGGVTISGGDTLDPSGFVGSRVTITGGSSEGYGGPVVIGGGISTGERGGGHVTIFGRQGIGASGGNVSLSGGTTDYGADFSAPGVGGNVTIYGGESYSYTVGGSVILSAGSSDTGYGGKASLAGGSGYYGGDLYLSGGYAQEGDGGNVVISGGDTGGVYYGGGSVSIYPGQSAFNSSGYLSLCTDSDQRMGFWGAVPTEQLSVANDAPVATVVSLLKTIGIFN